MISHEFSQAKSRKTAQSSQQNSSKSDCEKFVFSLLFSDFSSILGHFLVSIALVSAQFRSVFKLKSTILEKSLAFKNVARFPVLVAKVAFLAGSRRFSTVLLSFDHFLSNWIGLIVRKTPLKLSTTCL